jgi:hypothetical protein
MRHLVGCALKRSSAKEELDEVGFVRLAPVETCRGHRAEVQPIDVRGVRQSSPQLGPARDRAAHERRPIASTIVNSGHRTTATNGNMNSLFNDGREARRCCAG